MKVLISGSLSLKSCFQDLILDFCSFDDSLWPDSSFYFSRDFSWWEVYLNVSGECYQVSTMTSVEKMFSTCWFATNAGEVIQENDF